MTQDGNRAAGKNIVIGGLMQIRVDELKKEE